MGHFKPDWKTGPREGLVEQFDQKQHAKTSKVKTKRDMVTKPIELSDYPIPIN